MNRTGSAFVSRWAIMSLSVAVLALGGCGRKSGLDLPPYAPQPQASATGDTSDRTANTPSVFNPTYGSDAQPLTPKGPKKPFALDPLLND